MAHEEKGEEGEVGGEQEEVSRRRGMWSRIRRRERRRMRRRRWRGGDALERDATFP